MTADVQERRLLTSLDLMQFNMADDPQLAPDGNRVAWVRTWMDPERNGYRSQICVTSLVDGETQALTAGDGLETHPRWSPDGRFVAFLAPTSATPSSPAAPVGPSVSIVGKGAQLFVLPASGGEPRQLTALASGVSEPCWSPDGRGLAFITYAHPESGLTLPDAQPSDDPYEQFNRDVLVVNRLRWKSDAAGLVGNYRHHVAWLPFDETHASQAEPTLLTQGEFDLHSPTFSPDGKQLAVVGNLDQGGEEARKGYIYLLNLEGEAPLQPQQLFGLEEMRSSDLAWSPDGKMLAVCGHDDPQMGHYGNQRLWLVSVEGGEGTCVTEHLDFTFGDYSRNSDMRRYGGEDGPRWLPDGRGLLLLVNKGGNVHLNRFSLDDGSLTPLTEGDFCVTAFVPDERAEQIVLLVAEDLNPSDLFLLDGTQPDRGMRRLTAINEEFLGTLHLSRSLRFQFESDGNLVDGWLVPPVERESGKRYPLILYPGGGPGSMRASVFCHEFLLYASHGYAVVHCNARGNHGYGEDFSKAIRGEWGELDYRDNMACVRAALEQFDFLDPERLAVAGGSYGGFSTIRVIEREPTFKAAVVDRCLFNRYSFNGTSDMGFLLDRVEFDRQYPWEVPDRYVAWSPLTHVGSIQTPTLVVHSEQDHRCPVEQGEQLYMALKRLDVPTELVRFPNETHELSRAGRPWHRVFRLDRYLDWFERWL